MNETAEHLDLYHSIVFNYLQPFCVNIVKCPSESYVRSYENALNSASKLLEESACELTYSSIINKLQEYLFFPLKISLKGITLSEQRQSEKLVIAVLECCSTLQCNIKKYNSWPLCSDLSLLFLILILDKNNPLEIIKGNEEVKILVVDCLKNMFDSLASHVVSEAYNKSNLPQIAHVIQICLQLFQFEANKSLRLKCLDCLRAILLSEEVQQSSETVKIELSQFLPGIGSCLPLTVLKDPHTPHLILENTICLWYEFICILLDNRTYESLIASRGQQWISTCEEKVSLLIQKISRLVNHTHPNVRSKILHMANTLLLNCNRALPQGVPLLLDILLVSSMDGFESITVQAKLMLERVKNLELNNSVEDHCKSHLMKLITHLSSSICLQDNCGRLFILTLLEGYMVFLQDALPQILLTVTDCQDFINSLIGVSSFSSKEPLLLLGQEIHTLNYPIETDDLLTNFKKPFLYLEELSLVDKFNHICQIVGQYCDLMVLCDILLDLINTCQSREAIHILNCILSGSSYLKPDTEEILQLVIETYTESSLFYPPLEISNESLSISDKANNVLQVCLLLEGLRTICMIKSEWDSTFFIKLLYPTLEKAADPHHVISFAARRLLMTLAIRSNYSSLPNFLQDHVDYFSFPLTLQLRKCHAHPNIAGVIRIILEYGGEKVLLFVHEVLLGVLDLMSKIPLDSKSLIYLTKVLQVYAIEMSNLYGNDNFILNESEVPEQVLSVKDFVKNHINTIKISKLMEEEKDDDEAIGSEAEEEVLSEEKKNEEIPYVKMTSTVMKQCQHLLFSPDPNTVALTLDSISYCCKALQNHQNTLLPLVHNVWKPMLSSFSSPSTLVINQAFRTVVTLSECSGDFVYRRTCESIFPSVLSFLKSQTSAAYSRDNEGHYSFTQKYKLLSSMLGGLPSLIKKLPLSETWVMKLAWRVLPYLSNYYPTHIQDEAVKVMLALYKQNADGIWYLLVTTWCPDELKFKKPNFENNCIMDIKFGHKEEYRKGINKILTCIKT